MRVLYVNPFSQEVSGPDESLLAMLARAGRTIEAHVILPGPSPQAERYRALGAVVHHAPISILRRGAWPLRLTLYPFQLLRGAAAVARIARAVRPDVIHTNMEVVLDGGLAARLLGIPHVLHYRGNTLDHPRLAFDLLTRAWTRLSARVLCISHATAEIFVRRGLGERVEVLYNAVDLDAYAREPRSGQVRASLGAAEDSVLVGYVGRIDPRKNVATFVRAAAIVAARQPGARFVVVGSAETPRERRYADEVAALARESGLGSTLRFAGARRDMAAVFKALDVVVLPSRHEGFGRVVAEAMAAGRSLVVSREGAPAELVDDGVNGFTVPPLDAPCFADRIERLVADPALRARLGDAGLARAGAFSADAHAQRTLAIYDDVLAGRRVARPVSARMRVLYVTPFAQEISGADESLLDLLRELVPHGIEAHVALVERGPQASRYEAVGATVHVLPLSVLSRSVTSLLFPLYLLRLARGALAVRRLARSIRADVIHTNMEVVLDGGLAARSLRIPHVLHYRGNTIDEPRLVFDVLTRVWTRLADRVLCISRSTEQLFLRRGLGQHVETLYDPIPVSQIAAEERSEQVRSELGAEPGDVLVGTVGRIHPRKDMATFLRACALVKDQVPRARFVLVGAAHGPMEEAYERELRALASDLGLDARLRFAGMRRDVGAVMKALDVFVLSSRHEGFGRVVVEAMAAGTPVVLTREGALPELVTEGEEGFLAEAGRAEEFAAHIAHLCRDDEVRRAMGERSALSAHRFAAQLSADAVASRYRDLLSTGAAK